MSLSEVVIEGTLKPDGTLELDRKPGLSPGRVTVVLRQESASAPAPEQDWFQFMQQARLKMADAGCHFLNGKDVQAHIEWLREEDRMDELLRQAEQQRQKSKKP
jgi:hypothetical protein